MKILIIISFFAANLQSGISFSFAQSSKFIRVAIMQDVVSLRLYIRGLYEIIDSKSLKVIHSHRNLKTTVTAYKYGILIGNIKADTNSVLIKTQGDTAILINGRRFKGDIQFIRKNSARLLVVNFVDIEDYVKGILYHEVSHYWPQEALKAQAIVCRTYGLYQMQENKFKDFDVTSDIYSQVYGGMTSERYRTNIAVNETTGLVLTYQGKVFPAYYHATCAGYTEDASLLWSIDIPPLKGVYCGFCNDSPHFSWHYSLSLSEIKDKLLKAGFYTQDIEDIMILGRDRSGRITELEITAKDKKIKISAKVFRNVIGSNAIRSTNFTVTVTGPEAVFEGLGWGHGVGLCQWGAYFMAKKGHKLQEILKYYYPQAEVTPVF